VNRIKELRTKKGLKQTELARLLSVAQSTISGWESGRYEPDMTALAQIADILDTTVDCIIGGVAPPETIRPRNGVRIPVLGDVAAGIPIDAIENVIDYEEIDVALAATGEFFGLRIKGSSMEPRIREGDVVIVRKQEDAQTGDTAVVLVNGDAATVKRIKKEPGGISLIPNNPAYDTQFYSNAEICDLPVRIIGKVVELRGKF